MQKAQQLADTYWLYVVWGSLGDSPELMRIHNPVAKELFKNKLDIIVFCLPLLWHDNDRADAYSI